MGENPSRQRKYPNPKSAMPGIVGLITRMPPAQAKAQLQRMVATLRHDPAYDTGAWVDESFGIYVGWSVRRGSFADGMPLSDGRQNSS